MADDDDDMYYFIGGYINVVFFVGLVVLLYALLLQSKKKKIGQTKSYSTVCKNGCATTSAMEEKSDQPDIIIVGAGVAGAALAYALAKDGRQVRVIERDLKEPNRVVGEILHPTGFMKLIELGLQDCINDIEAQQLLGVVFNKYGKTTTMPYSLEKYGPHFSGTSFHNGRFVQRMREKAAILSNVRLEQGTVVSLIEEKGVIKGVRYKTKNSQVIASTYAPLTIVCDGSSSNLRRTLCTPMVETPSEMFCLILENCELPYPNYVNLFFRGSSPFLLYQISSTEIRLTVEVPRKNRSSITIADYLKTAVAPEIPPTLYDAFMAAIDKGNIKAMPNKSMPGKPNHTPGAILIGDALNMRHPMIAAGMTVALHDVVLLRDVLRGVNDLHDKDALSNLIKSFYALRKPFAFTINLYAGAFCKIFDSATEASPKSTGDLREALCQACCGYLSLGGFVAQRIIATGSGLTPHPIMLLIHALGIAVYGLIHQVLLPFPSPKRLWFGAKLLWVGFGVLFPLVKVEGITVGMLFNLIVPAGLLKRMMFLSICSIFIIVFFFEMIYISHRFK
ncbi:squalene epoxidase 3-like [Andrographis paniculata]|uniref:squalene epoxidase 3-like n=1 Tax=Andrographis paniculata TaxID=175694 RepID=UPI0021E731AF|nr:squalene epoxidase 3-like [Andrographis paniculata]